MGRLNLCLWKIWRRLGFEEDFSLLCMENKEKAMRRSDIVYRIKDALRQVAPEVKVILYGSEARGDARQGETRFRKPADNQQPI